MNDLTKKRAQFEAVRQHIETTVANRDIIARPRKLRIQLESLHDASWDQTWQRTNLLLLCYCRMKPARTHGRLMLLRNEMHAEGKTEEFATFMAQLTDILHPQFITPHGYTTTFSNIDSDKIYRSLGATLKPLETLGHPFFLYAGALLGHIRDGRLIDHDDDVDIAICLGECSKNDVAAKWLDYKRALHAAGFLDQAAAAEDRPVFKFRSNLNTDIDLFPAWTENGKFSVYPYSLDQMDANDVFPLADFEQDGLDLPADPEAMLAQSYGPDWRTPDPLFHLDWKRKKAQFRVLFQVSYGLI